MQFRYQMDNRRIYQNKSSVKWQKLDVHRMSATYNKRTNGKWTIGYPMDVLWIMCASRGCHLQLGKVSTYFMEMLIFGYFLKPKRRFIFGFFPLLPPFPLFTFCAATISLIHPLKFWFFGFKKSPKIVKTRWIYPSSNSKTWIEIWKSRWPINLLCWYPLKTEIHTNINHILHPPLLNTCTDSEYLYAVQFYNVNKTFVCFWTKICLLISRLII
jgi:hypothetical protein